jgi:hypothetical protein
MRSLQVVGGAHLEGFPYESQVTAKKGKGAYDGPPTQNSILPVWRNIIVLWDFAFEKSWGIFRFYSALV